MTGSGDQREQRPFDPDVSAAQIREVCERALAETLVDFTLFDVYTGKGIDFNEKSVAVGLTLQAPSATLTDEEIGRLVESAVGALAEATGARLR